MINDKIEIENYTNLFESNKLTWKSEGFEMSIHPWRVKKNS